MQSAEYLKLRHDGSSGNYVNVEYSYQGGNGGFLRVLNLKHMNIYLQTFRNVLVLPITPRCFTRFYITFRIFQSTSEF